VVRGAVAGPGSVALGGEVPGVLGAMSRTHAVIERALL
jgi:hypothetical protein